jgi:hypothetical protein
MPGAGLIITGAYIPTTTDGFTHSLVHRRGYYATTRLG